MRAALQSDRSLVACSWKMVGRTNRALKLAKVADNAKLATLILVSPTRINSGFLRSTRAGLLPFPTFVFRLSLSRNCSVLFLRSALKISASANFMCHQCSRRARGLHSYIFFRIFFSRSFARESATATLFAVIPNTSPISAWLCSR